MERTSERLTHIAIASGLSIDESIEWEEKIEKATENIGKCLDGFSVAEANIILDEVKRYFINAAVIRGD